VAGILDAAKRGRKIPDSTVYHWTYGFANQSPSESFIVLRLFLALTYASPDIDNGIVTVKCGTYSYEPERGGSEVY